MKIGPSDRSLPETPVAQAALAKTGQNAAAASTQKATSAGVAVTMSTQVRTLEQAKGADAADIDAKKVQEVKDAIEQGTYKVNAEAIADKLLANAQDMLRQNRV